MEKNPNAFFHIYLNVRLLPGTRTLKVPLTRESTASDVVEKCKETLNSDADYLLAADFNGFEKQFGAQERLYHLVKKHILWAGLDRQVQFFIRKKKKHVSVATAIDEDLARNNTKPVSKMMEREVTPTKCPPLDVEAASEGRLLADLDTFYSADGRFSPATTNSYDGQMMSERSLPDNSSSNDSLSSQLNAMSFAELIQLADRQKRQIEANSTAVASKEMRLNSLRGQQQQSVGQNGDPQAILSARLHQLRQQIKAEDAQLQHLRRLRAEVEDERRRSVTARVDLQEARRIFAEKERQLKEAANRVQDLMRQLDLVRRRRLILSKENELKRLDSALDPTCNGKLDKPGMAMAEISVNTMTGPQIPYQYQRPKAAIEPFKIVPPTHSAASISGEKTDGAPTGEPSAGRGSDYLAYAPSLDYLHSKGFVAAFSAMEEVLQQTTETRCPSAAGIGDGGNKNGYATGRLTPSSALSAMAGPKGQVNGENPSSIYATASSVVTGQKPQEYGNAPSSSSLQHQRVASTDQSHSAIDSQLRSETPLPQPVIPKVNISINRRFQIANASPLLYEERPPPDLIPASEKTKFNSFDEASTSDAIQSSAAAQQPRVAEHPASMVSGGVAGSKTGLNHHYPHHHHYNDTVHPRGEADKIHFRNDTIRAAKRRSWAENHLPATTDEAEHIRLLLARAQQRGKSSLNLSWIFDQMTTSSAQREYYDAQHQRLGATVSSITTSYPPPMPSQAYASRPSAQDDPFLDQPTQPPPPPPPPPTLPPSPPAESKPDYEPFGSKNMDRMEPEDYMKSEYREKSPDDEPVKIRSEDLEMFELNDDIDDQLAVSVKRQRRLANESSGFYETDDDDDDERSAATVVEIISSDIQLKPPPGKGILRLKPKDESERGRRIRFDTLALLLDAALEGELELVKSCASKVPNVSTCTEEGITALHNAICAGHYEIVRFLVEAGADVNAEDGDGWTPLHCAASCNNLPMVKFLIERGACIFATTTNDHETPADKCEEDEEGFDGCSQFLFGIQEKLGTLNGGRVYAAYDYEGEHEDELDLNADEPILVLRREDEKEKGWWWAKRENTGEEGYVPRNYLALYPRLAAQRAGAMAGAPSPAPSEPNPTKEETKTSVDADNEIPADSLAAAEP